MSEPTLGGLNEGRRRAALDHGWFGIGEEDEERWARRIAEAVFFEVVAIPGDVPPHAPAGFLVQRRALDGDGVVCDFSCRCQLPQRVPSNKGD